MSGRRKINKYFISSVEWYEPRLNITSEFWGSENTTDDELIPGICTPYNVDENDDIYDNHDRGDNDDDGNYYVNEYGEPMMIMMMIMMMMNVRCGRMFVGRTFVHVGSRETSLMPRGNTPTRFHSKCLPTFSCQCLFLPRAQTDLLTT